MRTAPRSTYRPGLAPAVLIAMIGLILGAGCGPERITAPSAVTATPQPTPTPTLEVGFVLKETPLPVRRPVHHRPRPTPTPIVPAFQPYLLLFPSAGPPVSRRIFVRGGNLPQKETVQLIWSPNGRTSPVSTTAYTDRKGRLAADFSLPGSPPGRYQIRLEINGVDYAAAWYSVTSAARLEIRVGTNAGGDEIVVSGRRFLADLKLVLVAYPVSNPKGYTLLGWPITDGRGRFSYRYDARRLPAGQYVLRAYSTSAVAAQMAEAPFEVVI